MKKWILIGFSVCLLLAGAAHAQSLTDWHWIKTSALGDTWGVQQGRAIVDISNGKVVAKLYAGESNSAVIFEMVGRIQFEQKITNMQAGVATILVKPMHSGMDPVEYKGNYKKLFFDKKTKQEMGISARETIILIDDFNVIGLVRQTK